MKKIPNLNFVYFVLFSLLIIIAPLINAQSSQRYNSFSSSSSASFINYHTRPSYQSLYGGSVGDYWPILTNQDGKCEAREDIILGIAPFGCSPSVVRSDLLAEQDVPVFCQLEALEFNPLIDIKEIKHVSFVGEYPPEIKSTGFHPARAALRSYNNLLSSPIVNNIGYVVVILRQQKDESKLPESVNVTLKASFDYHAGNVFGVGRSEFLLREVSDEEWEKEKLKQSFWNGRYSVRLEESSSNFAIVSIYDGDVKISTERLESNKETRNIYVPGSYCRVGLELHYDGFVPADETARIDISSDSGTESIIVTEGSRFLDDRCYIRDIKIDGNNLTGTVTGNCRGENFVLDLIKREEKTKDKEKDTESENSLENLKDAALSEKGKSYFDSAVGNYSDLAEIYGKEKEEGIEEAKTYDEIALERAAELAQELGMEKTRGELLVRLIAVSQNERYSQQLNDLLKIDGTNSAEVVEFDDRFRVLRLVSLSSPKEKSSAEFVYSGGRITIPHRETRTMILSGVVKANITLDRTDSEEAAISAVCFSVNTDGKQEVSKTINNVFFELGGDAKDICGVMLSLNKVEAREQAKIRIIPQSKARVETNFSVAIGIEKRAFELTPEKARTKIDELNDQIKKWEELSDKLGKTVKGLKTACFGTAAALTFKNFVTGLNGEALARQQVMNGPNGWKSECANLVGKGEYSTLDECFLAKSSEINRDVQIATQAVQSVNDKIKLDQEGNVLSNDLFGKSVNETGLRDSLAKRAVSEYGAVNINTSGFDSAWGEDSSFNVQKLLEGENKNFATVESIRSTMLYSEMLKNPSLSPAQRKNIEARMTEAAKIADSNKLYYDNFQRSQNLGNQYPSAYNLEKENTRTVNTEIKALSPETRTRTGLTDSKITHFAVMNAGPAIAGEENERKLGGLYFLGLAGANDQYELLEISKDENGQARIVEGQEKNDIIASYNIGKINAVDPSSYVNEIAAQDRKIRYYETGQYKGMPAIVPFDDQQGWYAATKQTLPVFGGIGPFDASGKVTSFWLCNVGKNHRIEILSGVGDDLCQQINLNTGQPIGIFPGLSQSQAQTLVNRAINAIQQAADQYGNKYVSILGKSREVGTAAVSIAESKCQDFMSPNDCWLMFNVCDPVICPPSRCNLGGKYQVTDVIQSGIVGSALLCLPNFNEGVIIPVCLTGIHAGIDGWNTILKSYRDCLNESISTGEYVGICDEIHSIYACDFFWNQVAPFADAIIPTLFDTVAGRGTRGGGEYLSASSAWENTEKSIDYFTNVYAVNSFNAFKVGNVEEIGAEVCKNFASLEAPSKLKSLTDPDSPPQFHAWFDSKKFSDVTFPATEQYKVFYHIFAGNNRGVHYEVYLRDPPDSVSINPIPELRFASGFIPKGEYRTETIDRTAPEGYKELCVRIDNEDHCGFKQVSSSFAVNYLRDSFVSQELQRTDIDNENECISGSPNAGSLLNPNIQAGAEEFINPEGYNRGIVRICATQNPGTGTNPTRFKDVGHCSDTKIRCWLDTKSIDNALTDSNILLRNQTLEALSDQTVLLDKDSLVYDQAKAEIDNIKKEIDDLKMNNINLESKSRTIFNRIESTFVKLVFSLDKAKLLLLKGDLNAKLARRFKADKDTIDVAPQCSDLVDNDNDGKTDLDDNDCINKEDGSESSGTNTENICEADKCSIYDETKCDSCTTVCIYEDNACKDKNEQVPAEPTLVDEIMIEELNDDTLIFKYENSQGEILNTNLFILLTENRVVRLRDFGGEYTSGNSVIAGSLTENVNLLFVNSNSEVEIRIDSGYCGSPLTFDDKYNLGDLYGFKIKNENDELIIVGDASSDNSIGQVSCEGVGP